MGNESDEPVVERLKESIWHPNQKLEDLKKGRARLTMSLNPENGFLDRMTGCNGFIGKAPDVI